MFQNWLSKLVDWFWTIIETVLGWLTAPVHAAVDAVVALFPSVGTYLDALQPYVGYIDYWIDVESCIAAFSAYVTFVVGWSAYRFFKSWLVGVSG